MCVTTPTILGPKSWRNQMLHTTHTISVSPISKESTAQLNAVHNNDCYMTNTIAGPNLGRIKCTIEPLQSWGPKSTRNQMG